MLRIILTTTILSFILTVNAQTFSVTLDVDYLNDGKRKSLLFSNELGKVLHHENLKAVDFKKDLIVDFDKKGSAAVHLTVFKHRERSLGDESIQKKYASTYCNLENNSVFNYYQDPNDLDTYVPEIPIADWEKKTLEIEGVFSLEDIVSETENYSISKTRVKKDSVLKIKISPHPEKDILIFMKINGEDTYRELLLSYDEKTPIQLILDDLAPNIELMELNFPYKDFWNTRVSGRNSKMDETYPLHTSNSGKKKSDFIVYPEPQEASLTHYSVRLSRWDSETDLRHRYHQFFEYAPSEVYHYDNFDFELENEFTGFTLNVEDESDYFEIFTSYNGLSRTSASTVRLFRWFFYGKIDGRKNIKIVYPEEIPEAIQKFIGGYWEAFEFNINSLSMLKLANPAQNADWQRPNDYFYILRDDSHHQCRQSFEN